jgi:hypothetical protein
VKKIGKLFSVKGQSITIFGFVGQMVSVAMLTSVVVTGKQP